MTAVLLATAALGALVLLESRRRRRRALWRARHEARWAAMAERRAQANGRPHSGQVTVLGGSGQGLDIGHVDLGPR